MRLRGLLLPLAVAASVGAMLVLAGPAAGANITCGSVLTSSTTLIGNLDCSGTGSWALRFDDAHPGVLLNLNGFWVKGAPGHHVINTDGAANITIKNGTLYVVGDGTGVANFHGSSNLTMDVVKIIGDGTGDSYGVQSYDGTNLTFLDGVVSGVDYAFYLGDETGDVIKTSTIETCSDVPAGNTCTNSYGVFSDRYLTNVTIMGNAFTSDAAQTGTAYYADYDAGTVFSHNTVTALGWGVNTDGYNAGLMITSNVFGGAAPADGLLYGIDMDGHDHGDVIAGNFIRNSFVNAVNDRESFNNTYVGNIATANGRAADDYSFEMRIHGYGPLTMVNNIARLGFSAGFYIDEAYSESVSGPPYSMFAGNSAIANGTDGYPGFYDFYSVGSTWKSNVAKYNAYDGFVFAQPWREIVDGNIASLNGDDGFLFGDVFADAQPLAVTNNTATYNGGYGFSGWDDESFFGFGQDAYPVAGSGNSGGGTNAYGDCYLVAGCG